MGTKVAKIERKSRHLPLALSFGLWVGFSVPSFAGDIEPHPYRHFSRFTDPGVQSNLLVELPDDPAALAAVASELTVHHNLLAYYGVPRDRWSQMTRPWPPKMTTLLSALAASEPRDLSAERPIENRLVGACMMESHLLAGMLRYREIPVRIRAGYFRNVQQNGDHVLRFWEKTLRARAVEKELLERDPDEWQRAIRAFTQKQIDIDKRIEHWVVEYWDPKRRAWRLLDANTTFLEASGGIEVGVHLPTEYFEFAFEAWQKMRHSEDFNADQYAEWPQDGRSHIRSQMLWDFYSLLNHDIAGHDSDQWPEEGAIGAEREAYAFVKERSWDELSEQELAELDSLAALLAGSPEKPDLIDFYRKGETLRLHTAAQDSYSFVFDD